ALRNRGLIFTFKAFRDGVFLLASLCDLHGNRAAIDRDEGGLPIRLTRSDGMLIVMANDRSGLRESVTLTAPNGDSQVVSRYRYDAG
ncbi:hypothetical protein L0M85_09955, partial [Streptococcus sp. DFI.7.26]|uniref:hypothetical protein n=1 Tax=Streptococcus sp. DFI.7.26 TaxID=2916965 RepID=UPI001EE80BF5